MMSLLEAESNGTKRRSSHVAFTLIEVLIVVVILAILAATVIPAFVDSSDDARDAALKQDLQIMRHQIQLFHSQHNGNWPGFDGVPFLFHLLGYSNAEGTLSATKSDDFPYGPYLPPRAVTNPFNGGNGWKASSDPPGETPDEAITSFGFIVGWFYDVNTGRISANAEGTTSDGTPRVQL